MLQTNPVGMGPAEELRGGRLAAAISSEMVRLFSDYAGRGPTKARTHLMGDVISVVLHDSLTTAERMLAQHGHADHVHRTRRLLQNAMRSDIVATVARLTGREVVALVCGNEVEPDITVLTVLLEPSDRRARRAQA